MERDSSESAASSAPTSRSPDLAVLASLAAIALDRRIQGHGVSTSPVTDLAIALGQALQSRTSLSDHAAQIGLLNPAAVDLISRALPRDTAAPPRTVRELTSAADDIIQVLKEPTGTLEAKDWKRLRDFCLALSQCVQSQWALNQSKVLDHPYAR